MNTVKPVTFSKRSRARMTLQSKTSVSTLQYVVAKGEHASPSRAKAAAIRRNPRLTRDMVQKIRPRRPRPFPDCFSLRIQGAPVPLLSFYS